MMSVLLMLGIVLSMGGGKADGAIIQSEEKFGNLRNPRDIEFDESGNTFIASDNYINKITPEGIVTSILSGGIYGVLNSVSDIEFDNTGNMYIANFEGKTINKITTEGILSTIVHNGEYGALDYLREIEFDAEDNLYILNSSNNTIKKISPEGIITIVSSGEEYGEFLYPTDIKFDQEGNIWLSYYHGFNIIEPEGAIYEIEYFDWIDDLELDFEGNIYLLSNSGHVTKISEEDVNTIYHGGVYGDMSIPSDLEFDSQHNLYIVNSGLNTITKVVDYSGIYNIISKNSNLLMDVYNGGKDQGVNVIQWPETGGQNQQWKFELLDNGFYKITSVLSGMSLDVYNAGLSEGNYVIQWPYHGGANQQWQLIENSDGTFGFKSRLSLESYKRYVLDVYNGGVTPGVNIIQWSYNTKDNQKWYLQPVEEHTLNYETNGGSTIEDSNHLPGVLITEPTTPTKDNSVFGGWYKDAELTQKWNFTKNRMPATNLTLYAKWEEDISGVYNIKSKNSNLVMDVYNGGTDQGVNVIQWPLHGRSNQQWKFEALNNGYYKVTSMLSGLSIDVYNGGTNLGNRVIQWPYHGGTNQQWKIIKNNDDTYSLMSRLAEESGTGYLLDVFGGGIDQGVNVIQWTAHYGNNQKWILESVK